MVSEGKGQVWGKDDPMQLSDIIPKKSMYDKMRPPKVEGMQFYASRVEWVTGISERIELDPWKGDFCGLFRRKQPPNFQIIL